MTSESEVLELIKSGKIMSFSGEIRDSQFETIDDFDFAYELATAQFDDDSEYLNWCDLRENASAKSYCKPAAKVPVEARQLVMDHFEVYEPNLNFRLLGEEVFHGFAASIRSIRAFGQLEPFWVRLIMAYEDGGLPCGLKRDGTMVIFWSQDWNREVFPESKLQTKYPERSQREAMVERINSLC